MKVFRRFHSLAFLLLVTSAAGCGPEASSGGADVLAQGEIRSISREEALDDFDQLVDSVRALYGPLEWKERRYGFDFEATAKQFRRRVARARSEATYFGLYREFLAQLRDAHVSLAAPYTADAVRSFSLPFLAMPIEDTYVVYRAEPGTGIERGDELLAINGVSARKLVADALRYVSEPGERSAKHTAAVWLTRRPVFLSQHLVQGAEARVQVRKASGETRIVSLNWQSDSPLLSPREPVAIPAAGESGQPGSVPMLISEPVAEVTHAELSEYGAAVPFYMSPEVKAELGVSEPLRPSTESLTKFGVTTEQADAAGFFATKYERDGKRLLLLRIPSYTPAVEPEVALNYLRALIAEQQPLVDALVLDETHNPGGRADFAVGLVSLLTPKRANSIVQRMNADRLWIGQYARIAQHLRASGQEASAGEHEDWARLIDEAYSARQPLSAPVPLYLSPVVEPDPVHWNKPLLVLVDELSVSCADFVPLIIQANGLGKIFGQTTMGGGGNVEVVARLSNTQAELRLTRGLGTVFDPTGIYPDARFVEDNGVTPDILYTHRLSDFRAGYLGYVRAFTDEALRLITPPSSGR